MSIYIWNEHEVKKATSALQICLSSVHVDWLMAEAYMTNASAWGLSLAQSYVHVRFTRIW